MTSNYQETLNDKWNDTYRRVESIEKRMDKLSDKINMLTERIDTWISDEKKRRLAER